MSHSETYTDTGPTSVFYQGVDAERERIIKLAENRVCFNHKNGCDHADCYSLSDLIRLIKGQQK
jgi:hypothetical protein